MTEGQDLNSLRRRLFTYYMAYYGELRRIVPTQPAYKSDPEALPYHLRDHARIVLAAECADGYAVIHSTAPDGQGYAFEVDNNKSRWTVAELSKIDVPPHGNFFDFHVHVIRKKATDAYALPKKRQERIDAVSYSRVATLTPDKARKSANSILRSFFESPNSPFFKAQPD